MDETQHTPGPWKAIKWTCHAPTTVVDDGGTVVADCSRTSFVIAASETNARLIAAAPELLEALEAVLEHWPSSKYWNELARPLYGTEADLAEITKQAEAAIRKAKGE